jgi:hypothetical protein
LPEPCFARLLKDLRNGSALARLDPVVKIHKTPAKLSAQRASHARLARTHEADKKNGPHWLAPRSGRIDVPART